jgi:CRISPR-associated endoribonuclease Cas6
MRIKIILKAEKLPIIYRHRIISLIKEALKKADISYKDSLYHDKAPRPFTFNNGELSLFLSSHDYQFIMYLFNGLQGLKSFSFSSDEDMLVNSEKINIEIKKVLPVNEKPIKNSEVGFKINSPFIIEDWEDNPILPDSPDYNLHLDKVKTSNNLTHRLISLNDYNEHLNKVQNMIFKTIVERELKETLEFTPVQMEKQIIKHTLKEFREKTGKALMYLTGSKGIFKLKGHPEDLDLIYKIGIGNRTSQGFGMLEVVG